MEFEQVNIEDIAGEYGLSLLFLFGSRASGRAHAGSDYDFAYMSEVPLGDGGRAKLRVALSRLAGHPDVEEVDLREAGPFLLREIIRNHRTLFSRDGSYERFYVSAVRTYLDESRIFALNDALYRNVLDKHRSYAR